jgi:hypothetical protein
MRAIHFRTIVAAFGLASFVACAETPTGTPVKTRAAKGGDVNAGAGSLESERRRLQGAWELTSLQIFSPTGEPLAAQATGRLQYDEYGNLTMRGAVTGGPEVDSSVLNIAGRVEIDPVAHTLRFRSITARSADERRVDPQIDASLVRYYEFDGDLLKTTVKAANGSTTATATWKRIQQ